MNAMDVALICKALGDANRCPGAMSGCAADRAARVI